MVSDWLSFSCVHLPALNGLWIVYLGPRGADTAPDSWPPSELF